MVIVEFHLFVTMSRSILLEFILFLQIYEKVAAAFNLDKDVVMANVDADKYKDLAEKWVQWHILIYLLVKLGWYHI